MLALADNTDPATGIIGAVEQYTQYSGGTVAYALQTLRWADLIEWDATTETGKIFYHLGDLETGRLTLTPRPVNPADPVVSRAINLDAAGGKVIITYWAGRGLHRLVGDSKLRYGSGFRSLGAVCTPTTLAERVPKLQLQAIADLRAFNQFSGLASEALAIQAQVEDQK
jgi:hypothetical protein